MISRAQKEHLVTALTWPENEAEFAFWFGDKIVYGSSADTIWQQIQADSRDTFVFTDETGQLGFGQCYEREANARHIACLIVAPQARGQGVGRRFVTDLMNHALSISGVNRITLNVYPNNAPARKLYLSLGFNEVGENRGMVAMRYDHAQDN
ncbi:N-acetyltransferase [Idiomarina sp. OT37-5b]|uniref:N-acetyltransferase n=1 Tax=Idiomarina aquatica TaxID=1327752 RepID=A0AA94EDA6_9GAMM|nr:GNAT family N-acetyltransferase [Idiomarina sp. OT37-5b]AVJ57416.1 N-acetyltransferase [Idiomarina sp. OT37-5b]RUO40430.1 N-acetyltransferase [Idiomarina aquatica]